MNILIRFEDRYGCKTLFNYSNSILNNIKNVDISCGFGDCGVFKVTKAIAQSYDYIILVFDMDSPKNMSLTSDELMFKLNKYIVSSENGSIKSDYMNKIILIPVFFSFETLYLYSKQLKDVIENIGIIDKCQSKELVELYKLYYDYSKICPEKMDGIAYKLCDIQNEVNRITNSSSSNKWYPQKFHLSYSKQVLKLICSGIDIKDKILSKSEDELFKKIINNEIPIDLDKIYDGIHNESIYIITILIHCYLWRIHNS